MPAAIAASTPASAALSNALFSGSSGSAVPKLPVPNDRLTVLQPSFTALSTAAIIAESEALSWPPGTILYAISFASGATPLIFPFAAAIPAT